MHICTYIIYRIYILKTAVSGNESIEKKKYVMYIYLLVINYHIIVFDRILVAITHIRTKQFWSKFKKNIGRYSLLLLKLKYFIVFFIFHKIVSFILQLLFLHISKSYFANHIVDKVIFSHLINHFTYLIKSLNVFKYEIILFVQYLTSV